MAFRASDVIGLVWHHPIVSVVVLLLFTPPLFPIVVYFSPLLISTALFVVAMISMGSDPAESQSSYSNDSPYKRVWIEEVDFDGPSLDGERVPKRLRAASSKDESWFGKVKNWEGTGRAWVESVLSQEARISFGSDDNAGSTDESIPLLDKTRGFFIEDGRKHSREPDYVPTASSKPIDAAPTAVSANESVSEKSESVPLRSVAVAVDSGKLGNEITAELESEDELIEIAPSNIPPSPLFRGKSLPKADATDNVPVDVSKTKDGTSEVEPKSVESTGSVLGIDSEDGKKSALGSDSTNEKDSIAPVVESAGAHFENGSNSAAISPPNDVSVAKESNLLSKEAAPRSVGEIMPELKALSSGLSSADVADRSLAEKAYTGTATDGDSAQSGAQPPSDTKSAAELLAPLRQGQQASDSRGTPSAAVALSEKLKVPLADIMSLLAGEEKENVPVEAPSCAKVTSSSETTTTSHEEEWSSSDVESAAPFTAVPGTSSTEKAA